MSSRCCIKSWIKSIGPDRLPELDDKKNLPHLEATITETLSLSSLVPLSIPHKTTLDTTLQGYSIPKGTTVLMNVWSLHHDPEIWDEPEVFRPERFLDEEGNFVPPKADRFLPFSAGRRVCMGEPLARIELLPGVGTPAAQLQVRKSSRLRSSNFGTRRRNCIEATAIQCLCSRKACCLTFI